MKKQLIAILMGVAFSATAFASDQSPVDVKGSGAAMEQGFEAWGKDNVKQGGPGGQVLEGEVEAWVQDYNKMPQT
ncbi:MAG: hypothetical protein PF450_11250 [Bacteroidales bacterium]|jgi:hypothetical protein|nr:hypothetical protein [Bacteroidales bacterium]